MILLFDIGNSRIKFCYSKDRNLVDHNACEYDDTNFEAILEKLFINTNIRIPNEIYVSSVAGDLITNRLISWCEKQWNIQPCLSQVSNQFNDLKNAYSDISQFGVDRWMAMIAARAMTREYCLVVDCGTAVTLDAINQNGSHAGGLIVPGVMMMQTSLLNDTRDIIAKELAGNSQNTLLGRSSVECLNKGSRLAISALIERVYHQFIEQEKSNKKCIITGGGSLEIMGSMTIDYLFEPHLVLQGLEYWRLQQ